MLYIYVTNKEVFLAIFNMKEFPCGAENEKCPPKK